MYALLVLVRNTLAGLDGVPDDVRESARGMGYGRGRMLWKVELPVALPTIMAGVRVATVSTVALATVGVIVGNGGLGQLIFRGFNSDYHAEILTASLLTVGARARPRPPARADHPGADAVEQEPVVSSLSDAFVWLNDPLNWQGPQGVPHLTWEHLYISGLAVGIAAVVAMPLRCWLGHTGRGGGFTVVVTNVSRAIPTLALLTVFSATAIGFGNRADDHRAGRLRDPAAADQHLRRGPRGRPGRASRRRAGWACPAGRC